MAGEEEAGAALLRLGAAAVATPAVGRVRVVTKAGQWAASLPASGANGGRETAPASLPASGANGGRETAPASLPASGANGGWETAPASLGALVAGLVPGFLLGWSWPDLLRHAVAVSAAANTSGKVDLAVYERLLDAVTVDPAR